MGIRTETFGFVHKCLFAVFPDLKFAGRYMVELGDQKFNENVALWPSGGRIWAKDYFERLGFHHYSIDWHGKNGAFALDLAKEIKDVFWYGRFDILTNLGTSEHVLNQYACWENMHDFVRKGGAFVHVLPLAGKLPEHSPFHYDLDFFRNLAKANDYRIIFAEKLTTIDHCGVCMVKNADNIFVKEFEGWPTK